MKAFALLAASALACAFASCGEGTKPPELQPVYPTAGANSKKPNVVVVMTDDQDVASLDVMPIVKRTLTRRGVTFENTFASYPLCCPSRATFQTGQHAHNHGVLSNKPPEGGYPAFDPSETLPVWLDREGYETAHFGKYLNHYLKGDEVPPGWDRWFGVVEPASRYFKVHVNDQGTLTKFGGKDPDLYSTDLFTDRAVEFIEEREGEPFYMSIGYVAPHVGKSFQEFGHCDEKGPEPAPRHLGMFDEKEIPRGPAFNEKDVTDKPSDVQDRGKVSGLVLAQKTDKYQCRLEALQSVDEGVGQLVDALRDAGELDDTYIIFVSDNGFIQGEHRIEGGKAVPYESAIHIPMIVRGPGVAKDQVAPALISNVDVVPTLLELTGAEPELVQDGRSFLKQPSPPEQAGRARGPDRVPLPAPELHRRQDEPLPVRRARDGRDRALRPEEGPGSTREHPDRPLLQRGARNPGRPSRSTPCVRGRDLLGVAGARARGQAIGGVCGLQKGPRRGCDRRLRCRIAQRDSNRRER